MRTGWIGWKREVGFNFLTLIYSWTTFKLNREANKIKAWILMGPTEPRNGWNNEDVEK